MHKIVDNAFFDTKNVLYIIFMKNHSTDQIKNRYHLLMKEIKKMKTNNRCLPSQEDDQSTTYDKCRKQRRIVSRGISINESNGFWFVKF